MALKNDYDHLMNNYMPLNIEFERGEGPYLWDVEGKRYLDFVAGIAVMNLGHSHPRLVEAIREQAGKLIHVSNLYRIPPQAELANLLCQHSFGEKCFFANSGAEAMEAAIKLARMYGLKKKGSSAFEIITADGSFHGRTMGAMTATAQAKIQEGFGPLIPGFGYVPFGDISAMEEAISEDTAAVILEPIQGENGVIIPPEGYLKAVRELCDKENVLLVFDEIQTGMGRTGNLFAYEYYGVVPDIMTLAKGLAGGLPMGACISGRKAADTFEPGNHASTFGGNPLVSQVAKAVLNVTLNDGILANTREVGDYFMSGLMSLKDEFDIIKEVRGRGLMIGVELNTDGKEIVDFMLKKNILINLTGGSVLRFLPPLIIGRGDVDVVIEALRDSFRKVS